MSLLLDSIEFVANYATLWTGNQGGITLSRSERAIGYRREFKTIFALTLIGILKEFSIIRKKLRKYSEDSIRNPPTSDPERIFSEL